MLTYVLSCRAGPESDLRDGAAAFERGDLLSAMTLYKRAADAGSAPAQSRLGYLLDYAEENESAVRWYTRAAEQGHPEGQHGLAEMYAKGEGVERDSALALSWFTRAAEQGHLPSVRVLANAFEKGELHQSIDHGRVIFWLRKGQEHHDSWSVTRLARAYQLGELGLTRDPGQAKALEASIVRSQ